MPKIEKWEKKVAWIVSTVVGAAILITAAVTHWNTPLFDEYLLLAVLITVFPPAVLDYVHYRWKRAINEHLPDLFRSLIQAQQAGMPLPQALEEASKRRYGPLTGELNKMVTQMSWGASFEKVLQSFRERVNTALVKSVVPLIVEAGRSGGPVEKVFAPTGKFIRSTLTLDKKRQTHTRPYVAIVYVAFFVFLFTIIILSKTLFAQATEFIAFRSTALTFDQARTLFFHMSVIEAFFGGLVAGKMGEGTVSAGLKHSVVLLTAGYLALKFLI
ncbi:MAG: type II secretion system F family protein [Candidatus Bathyarchaeota archaeon]|nr:MAG: type II secretion system F family protein [Candidatus Bathyarchaeota archaeon]